MKLLVFFGGPSLECGISLNSARSFVDHLAHHSSWTIELIFVSKRLEFYHIDKKWLYCNTTEDFEFKVLPTMQLTTEALITFARDFDLVFPLIHGKFGEDGGLQSFFQQYNLPFLGSPAETCRRAFFKSHALDELTTLGLSSGPFLVWLLCERNLTKLASFMANNPSAAGYILKPDLGGSSIGVERFQTVEEFLFFIDNNKEVYDQKVVIEPFYQAQEFCITVIEHIDGTPCALMPCTIHYQAGDIFDFRKKYLPSQQTTWNCPPLCSHDLIERIRNAAQNLFVHFGCRHIARFDGWIFPDGRVSFSDINVISGMEQNSLVFMQAAVCGLSHQRLCDHIIESAVGSERFNAVTKNEKIQLERKKVFVVFGGETAERQVSLMSGSNVWLKLRGSSLYEPVPFLLGLDGKLYQVPYYAMLYHTVEEVYAHMTKPVFYDFSVSGLQQDLHQVAWNGVALEKDEFCRFAQKQDAFVFIALHGGEGENGQWQRLLTSYQLPFNGSYEDGSAIGMDKIITGDLINKLHLKEMYSLRKISLSLALFPTESSIESLRVYFEENKENAWIIKPRSDGCSTGIIVLKTFEDLRLYYRLLKEKVVVIPPGSFYQQNNPVHMPDQEQEFMIEPYIQTDRVIMKDGRICYQERSGWIEITQAVLEYNNQYHALEGSLAVTTGAVLSLEEKFQGGTGTNLTPIPFLTQENRLFLKHYVCLAAETLSIKNYARFDLFYHQKRQEIIVIEVNTLPALTPSTVLYHQALADHTPHEPRSLLELLITRGLRDQKERFKELLAKVVTY